jgi:ABC-type nitrate/sulfonate/bicarbonate transport system permease component
MSKKDSLLITLQITIVAFIAAAISGLLMTILFSQSKWIERSLFPYAVILQTTPIVAIAPLIILWLKNSGGLALIGAVVAEFVAGTGGAKSGIAYRILISSYNLQIPRMFAALLLTTGLGVLIFVSLSALSGFILSKWHESAVEQEN